MPAHLFVEVEGHEATYCPECSYTMIPSQLPLWNEQDFIEWLVGGNLDEASARTVAGAFIIAREFLAPSSQELQDRITDMLNAARVAGWRNPEVEGIIVGVDKVAHQEEIAVIPRTEVLAKAYAQQFGVDRERAHHAVVNAYDGPPAPVSEVSAKIEQRAKAYAKEHNVDISVAVEKVLESDPALAKMYVAVPVFPHQTASTELTQDELLASLGINDLLQLCVNRKLAVNDAMMRLLVYEWFVLVDGLAHGSPAAAEAAETFWVKVNQERFKKDGFSDQQPVGR